MRICVIKLGALGDVLRTTCILPGLKQKYSQREITWVTNPVALPLLQHNPYVGRIVTLQQARHLSGARNYYDLVISLDEEPEACGLSSTLNARAWFGSYIDASGRPRYTKAASPWFRLGLLGPANRDDLKKANRKSYPSLLYAMLKLAGEPARPVLHLTRAEMRKGKSYVPGLGIQIGVSTGAGGRWELKRLSESKTVQLIREIQRIPGVRLWLLGGPEEHERNGRIRRATEMNAVPNHELRDFAAAIANLDLLVTSDSLALHIALALSVPVVVFFGPTSAAEVELYGIGKKILPDKGFQCFYTDSCRHTPTCETFQTVAPIATAVFEVLDDLTTQRRKAA